MPQYAKGLKLYKLSFAPRMNFLLHVAALNIRPPAANADDLLTQQTVCFLHTAHKMVQRANPQHQARY